jgi:hypothetical protein
MLRLRERLRKLERSPMLQRLPDPVDPTVDLALRQISDEDLALLVVVVSDQEAGICRTLSPRELVAVAAYETAFANVKEGELRI